MDPDAELAGQKVGKLRSLATFVENLVDKPHEYAGKSMKDWKGPNAEDTRGDLRRWKKTCHTIAENLRQEATDLDKSVKESKTPGD